MPIIKRKNSMIADERRNINRDAKIVNLEAKLDELIMLNGLKTKQIDEHQFEVIKDEELASGDYTNPIRFIEGMVVETSKWYYLDDKDLPFECLKDGIPSSFYDKEYFDVIEL